MKTGSCLLKKEDEFLFFRQMARFSRLSRVLQSVFTTVFTVITVFTGFPRYCSQRRLGMTKRRGAECTRSLHVGLPKHADWPRLGSFGTLFLRRVASNVHVARTRARARQTALRALAAFGFTAAARILLGGIGRLAFGYTAAARILFVGWAPRVLHAAQVLICELDRQARNPMAGCTLAKKWFVS